MPQVIDWYYQTQTEMTGIIAGYAASSTFTWYYKDGDEPKSCVVYITVSFKLIY